MTYTTVHKTYQAETLAAAAESMLRDPDIWTCVDGCREPKSLSAGGEHGGQKGYSVESWKWDAEKHELTVNFR